MYLQYNYDGFSHAISESFLEDGKKENCRIMTRATIIKNTKEHGNLKIKMIGDKKAKKTRVYNLFTTFLQKAYIKAVIPPSGVDQFGYL